MANETITSVGEFIVLVRDLLHRAKPDVELAAKTSVFATDPEKLNTPLIVYNVESREPMEDHTGYKPKWKGEHDKPEDDKQLVEFSQIFETVIEFGVLGSIYKEVDKLREDFELLFIDNLHVIRESGVLEFVFLRQNTDELVEIKDHEFSKQPLQYYLRYERPRFISQNTLTDINATLLKSGDYNHIRQQL